MFQKIQQLIDDKDALVFVLIDEVKIALWNYLQIPVGPVLLPEINLVLILRLRSPEYHR